MSSEDAPPVTRTAAVRRGLIALGFIAPLVGVGIGAGLTASSSLLLPVFEVCCLYALLVVVLLELLPAIVDFGGGSDGAARRREIRCFRRQLDALPETAHPLGA
jgi:hypothetical protein